MATYRNEPGTPPAGGTVADLKATPSMGLMHLCRFEDCEVWVADGGDHRCVLHSEDAYAIEMRAKWLTAYPDARPVLT